MDSEREAVPEGGVADRHCFCFYDVVDLVVEAVGGSVIARGDDLFPVRISRATSVCCKD